MAAQFAHYDTKQGVYAMTPEGEYLAACWGGDTHRKVHVLNTMTHALQTWRRIALQRGLPEPKPNTQTAVTTWGKGKAAANRINHAKVGVRNFKPDGLLLMVTSRDLPRKDPNSWKPGVYVPNRYPDMNMTIDEIRNYNWLALSKEDAKQLVADAQTRRIPQRIVRRIARKFLKDNVRGQAPGFRDEDIKKA